MSTLSFKIAYPIVIAGFFVIVSVIALNYNSLNASFYIILSFLTVYLFLFGFATGQNFAAPVKRLLKKADDLSRGDLKSRFYSESKDEIGQLSSVFNRIADRLEESNTENEKIEKSVGIKVEAETQSLKDIINALEQKVQNRTLEVQKMVRDLEKFKEYSGEKEADSIVLKNQILELKEKLEKHGDKKTKIKNEGEESGKTEKPEKIENEKTDEKS
ncbi:MAG: hypothetical protein A2908_00785 [Candidatus Staskawiczbacteria bacterium RIFCSPLOWO2_01_FULL_38_12b]|uniref:HAMP domain-containing protein n=1 Tax=Candidatus Staskawiczbacteria bacterium RIFCSPLOWO2_01_FULL_38_12b TaxID=1802214 RepID=A0A1G2IHC6_9BACT|nr:MAG: hypothetical protein A2908_00785 [Candidatus Staskawiczbacteria bacterium RIFCSPLOWO2_01_FULL_38_12b]